MAERSPDEIEREVQRERAGISQTVDELEDRLSVGRLAESVARGMNDGGGQFMRNLTRQVQDNPAAVLMVGAGLAWLASGYGAPSARGGRRRGHPLDSDWPGVRDPYAEDPSVTAWRPTDPEAAYAGVPYGGVGEPGGSGDGASVADKARDRAHGAAEAASGAAAGVGRAAGRVGKGARDAGAAAGEAAGSAAGRASGAARHAAGRAGSAADRARHAGARGAYRAADASREAADEAADFVDRNPLFSGAIAFAVGAAIGSLAPNTRRENELIGGSAEHLRGRAADQAAEEADKAGRVVRAAADEARRIGEEAAQEARRAGEATAEHLREEAPGGREAVDAAERKAREAGERVAAAARDEAERSGLADDARRLRGE